MLLEVDPLSLAKMADVLLRDREAWSLKQWENQCRFFSALATELEKQAVETEQSQVANEIHDTAWRFALAAMEGWPPNPTLEEWLD